MRVITLAALCMLTACSAVPDQRSAIELDFERGLGPNAEWYWVDASGAPGSRAVGKECADIAISKKPATREEALKLIYACAEAKGYKRRAIPSPA